MIDGNWTWVHPDKCEFEGPYECPSCGGHIIFDCTYIEQVDEDIRCPYCGTWSSVPEEDELEDTPGLIVTTMEENETVLLKARIKELEDHIATRIQSEIMNERSRKN
jgi:hypothetical protein